jgi:hypothetical protein
MSAYKKIKCNIIDKETLVKALSSIGFEPLVHDLPQHLRGYRNDIRKDTAEIIVPKEQINSLFTGASNDLGFKWNEEESKYEIVCSDYDSKFKIDERVIQAYTKVVIEEALDKQGYKIKVNVADEDLKKRKQTQIEIVARKII